MMFRREAYVRGATQALPFVVIFVPFALLFGVLAQDAGLTVVETAAFSLTVFAGAAQFAALAQLQDQVPVALVIVTGLVVNLRFLMFSIALAPVFGPLPLRLRAWLAYFIVDQSFAMTQAEVEKRPDLPGEDRVAFFMGAVSPVAALWMAGSVAGAALGHSIPQELVPDFALPLSFIALVAPMLRSGAHWAAAAVSAVGTVALGFLPYGAGLLVAAALAMVAGALWELAGERRLGH